MNEEMITMPKADIVKIGDHLVDAEMPMVRYTASRKSMAVEASIKRIEAIKQAQTIVKKHLKWRPIG